MICRLGEQESPPKEGKLGEVCGESNLKEGNRNHEKGRRELMEKFSQLT